MYSSSNVTKVIIYAAVIGGVIYGVNRFQANRREAVSSIVVTIEEVAALLEQTGGRDPEAIALVIAKLEDSSLADIKEAIGRVEDGPAQYIAVELVLRRIFEMRRSAILRSGIDRKRRAPEIYPWNLEGESASLEPFEIKSSSPDKLKFIFDTFESQGNPRRPWK